MRAWFPNMERHYFPLPDRGLYCVHPHGVFTIGVQLLLTDLALAEKSKVVVCTAPFLSTIAPVAVMVLRALNIDVCSARKEPMRDHMRQGHTLILTPGGFHEMSLMGDERVYIKKRKGFLAIAIKEGYTIIPTYCLGEAHTYHTLKGRESWRFHANAFDIPTIIFYGHYLCPFVPRRIPLTLIVGPQIPLPKKNRPGIEEDHKRYIATLKGIVRHYGKELEVW